MKRFESGGQGVICLNTQDIACILVYVSFLDILDNKKFTTCWYTCHLRSPTFMVLNEHLSVLISSTSTIFQKVVLVVLVVLLSTWLCAESHTSNRILAEIWMRRRESNQSTKNFIDPSSNKYTFATFPYN